MQDEIFGAGQDNLIAGTLSWQGAATAVEGGYRVEGRWQFGSGVDNAQWVMLGCADAQTHAPAVHVVVPAARSRSMTPGAFWACAGPAAKTWWRMASSSRIPHD